MMIFLNHSPSRIELLDCTAKERDCCSLARVRGTTHRISAGHFGQHLRQVRERNRDLGQVLGHCVVHDAEEIRRAKRGVDLYELGVDRAH